MGEQGAHVRLQIFNLSRDLVVHVIELLVVSFDVGLRAGDAQAHVVDLVAEAHVLIIGAFQILCEVGNVHQFCSGESRCAV